MGGWVKITPSSVKKQIWTSDLEEVEIGSFGDDFSVGFIKKADGRSQHFHR